MTIGINSIYGSRVVKFTEGHRRLKRWMRSREHSQADVARLVGATQAAVSIWLLEGTVPDAVSRMILAETAKIPMESWLLGKALRRLQAAREHGVSS